MQKILTCIDSASHPAEVCKAGVWAAQKLGLPLTLLHALEKDSQPAISDLSGAIGLGAQLHLLEELAALDGQRSQLAMRIGKELLARAQQLATELGCTQSETLLRHGSLVDAASDLATEARLLVMGRRGEPFRAQGSLIEQMIRQQPLPVLLPGPDFTAPASFMLAYDGRAIADQAVERIIEGGLLRGMTCHLVTVNRNRPGLQEAFNATRQRLQEHGFEVRAELIEGGIFDGLLAYANREPVDLLVMGACSRSRLASMFVGSNTLKMLEQTRLPLLVVR